MISSYPVCCPHPGCDWQGNLVPSHLRGGADATMAPMQRAWFQCPRCHRDWEVRITGDTVTVLPLLEGGPNGSEGDATGAKEIVSLRSSSRAEIAFKEGWMPEHMAIPGPIEDAVVKSDPVPRRGRDVTDSEIQMLAYFKWEAAGKPKGRGHEAQFWLEATQELHEGKRG